MNNKLGKVLIVDDDENICEVINMYLLNGGYETRLAHNGKEAVNSFLDFNPNISFSHKAIYLCHYLKG